MLFVGFLEKEYSEQFKKFLIDLEGGMDFSIPFRSAFGADAMTMWDEFKSQVMKN
jgi:hypothetical protein